MENLTQFPTSPAAEPADHRNADSGLSPDSPAFQALQEAYREQYHPVEPAEENLIAILAESEWKRRRVVAAEAELLQILLSQASGPLPLGATYQADLDGRKMLPELFRQIATLNRTIFQAMNKLDRIGQQRRSAAKQQQTKTADPAEPVAGAESPVPEPETVSPEPVAAARAAAPDPLALPFSPRPAAPSFARIIMAPELPPGMSRISKF